MLLKAGINKIGKKGEDGTVAVTFGELFKDEELEQQLESLVGSLKAAKKRKILTFEGRTRRTRSNSLLPCHALRTSHRLTARLDAPRRAQRCCCRARTTTSWSHSPLSSSQREPLVVRARLPAAIAAARWAARHHVLRRLTCKRVAFPFCGAPT